MQPYTAKAGPGLFLVLKDESPDIVRLPLKLVVTAIEGDAPRGQDLWSALHQRRYGCQVAVDGQVKTFDESMYGRQCSWHPSIPADDQKRLDKLLAKLPDDGARLPPVGRRVMLQVPEGDHSRARVYDRANAPDEVLEILRLSLSGIRSSVPEIKPKSEIRTGGYGR
jgi:hypothetical protein